MMTDTGIGLAVGVGLSAAAVVFSAVTGAAGVASAAGFIGQVLQFGGVVVLAGVLWHLNRETRRDHKEELARRDKAEADALARHELAVAKELKRTEDVETKLHEFYGRLLTNVKGDHRKEQQAAAEIAIGQFTAIRTEIAAVDEKLHQQLSAWVVEVRAALATLVRQTAEGCKASTPTDTGGDTHGGGQQRGSNPRR